MGLCVEVVDCDCLGNFAANSSRPSGRFAISFTNTHLQKLREGEKKTGSLASEFQFTRLPALHTSDPDVCCTIDNRTCRFLTIRWNTENYSGKIKRQPGLWLPGLP